MSEVNPGLGLYIQYEIDAAMDLVWSRAERMGLTPEEVDRAFQHYGVDGFDEWYREGEE